MKPLTAEKSPSNKVERYVLSAASFLCSGLFTAWDYHTSLKACNLGYKDYVLGSLIKSLGIVLVAQWHLLKIRISTYKNIIPVEKTVVKLKSAIIINILLIYTLFKKTLLIKISINIMYHILIYEYCRIVVHSVFIGLFLTLTLHIFIWILNVKM